MSIYKRLAGVVCVFLSQRPPKTKPRGQPSRGFRSNVLINSGKSAENLQKFLSKVMAKRIILGLSKFCVVWQILADFGMSEKKWRMTRKFYRLC
jgi:hypothetical protein